MFVNKLFTYLTCAYQNVKGVLMRNLRHIIFMWRRRYLQIFKSSSIYLSAVKCRKVLITLMCYLNACHDSLTRMIWFKFHSFLSYIWERFCLVFKRKRKFFKVTDFFATYMHWMRKEVWTWNTSDKLQLCLCFENEKNQFLISIFRMPAFFSLQLIFKIRWNHDNF